MKSVSFRIVLILSVLLVAAAVLPASAECYTQPDPASCASAWWDVCPPVVVKTRVVVRQPER